MSCQETMLSNQELKLIIFLIKMMLAEIAQLASGDESH